MTIRIDMVRDGTQPAFPNPVSPWANPSHWFTAKIVGDQEYLVDVAHVWAFSNISDLSTWLNTRLNAMQTADRTGVVTPDPEPPPPAVAPIPGVQYVSGTLIPGYVQLADGTMVKS